MIASGFEFTSYQPRISFREQFHMGGQADIYGWEHTGGIPSFGLPDISGLEVNWHLETERTVFDYYAEMMGNMGREITTRTPDFADYWRPKAQAMLWLSDGSLSVTLASPANDTFVAFASSVVAAGLGLTVWLPTAVIAEVETAPAPSVDAFMNREEPLFFGQAFFSPYRPKGGSAV